MEGESVFLQEKVRYLDEPINIHPYSSIFIDIQAGDLGCLRPSSSTLKEITVQI